jgi:hypothetical protein
MGFVGSRFGRGVIAAIMGRIVLLSREEFRLFEEKKVEFRVQGSDSHI